MSRIGKNPIAIPAGVTVELAEQRLTAKGALGALSLVVNSEVTATIADGAVTIAPKDESQRARAMWGTTRALVNNMVTGVATGFTRVLDINGVGYRAAVQGSILNLQLGYSHDIPYPIPSDVKINCERPTLIAITGADTAAASAVGKLLAERAKAAGVERVVFDRGAYMYHGRIKALADAAREGGLNL